MAKFPHQIVTLARCITRSFSSSGLSALLGRPDMCVISRTCFLRVRLGYALLYHCHTCNLAISIVPRYLSDNTLFIYYPLICNAISGCFSRQTTMSLVFFTFMTNPYNAHQHHLSRLVIFAVLWRYLPWVLCHQHISNCWSVYHSPLLQYSYSSKQYETPTIWNQRNFVWLVLLCIIDYLFIFTLK